MKNFTNEQQKKLRPTIKYDAWINTALLSSLLLSAFLKQQPAYLEIFLLFITWTINRMQQRELNWNQQFLFPFLNTVQNLIMFYGIVSYLMIFIR